jgi:predicted XRE-type DNA-binding protein
MTNTQSYESVWDALEEDPIRRENLKLRSELMTVIIENVKNRGLTQQQTANLLHITQPRVRCSKEKLMSSAWTC